MRALAPLPRIQAVTGYLVAGPTDKEMEKEASGFLIKTDSARNRQEQEEAVVAMQRLDARLLGDTQPILDEAISEGVAGKLKPALPKAALGVAHLPSVQCSDAQF